MSRRTRTTLAVIGLLIILISLAVLVYALWPAGSTSQRIPLPTDLFIRLDPLAGLSSGLAGRMIPDRFAPALILVVATLLLGRVWCGWLCPLGTVLDLVGGPLGVIGDSRSRRWATASTRRTSTALPANCSTWSTAPPMPRSCPGSITSTTPPAGGHR